jgi:hypothetical protein
MSFLRKVFALGALAITCLVVLLAGPAGSAAASSGIAMVQVSGTITLVDDDYDFDPTISRTITPKVFAVDYTGSEYVITLPGCAGGEVRAELHLQMDFNGGPQDVSVAPSRTGLPLGQVGALRMFEGDSCSSGDLDGLANFNTFHLSGNTSRSITLSTGNQDEGGNDRATMRLTITRIG